MTGKTIIKRGLGGVSLDLPMAALAAGSVAFVAYAMPDALFSGAVEASGLPSLLPAAQPPLGMTARLMVVCAGAVAVFVLTWFVLRALGNGTSPTLTRRDAAEEIAPLRLRRADAHPDAPSRHPLLAGMELGEPDTADEANDEEWEEALPGCVGTGESADDFAPEEWDDPADETAGDDVLVGYAEPPMELEEPTIAHLMQRLELGLIRRGHNELAPSFPSFEPEELADEAPPVVDDRLRSALDGLRAMAARGA